MISSHPKATKAVSPSLHRDRASIGFGVFIVAVSIWYVVLAVAIERQQLQLPYFVTEYMVTFAAGFIRRGILGQCFWTLGTAMHFSPLIAIQIARAGLATAYLAVLGFQCFKHRSVLGWLGTSVILFNPLVNFYAWNTMGALDLMFLLITVFHLHLAKTARANYWRAAMALFWTAGVFLVLSHEAFVFLGLPLNVLVAIRTLSKPLGSSGENCQPPGRFQLALKVGVLFLGCGVACIIASLFHGTPEQAETIARTWTSHGVQLPRLSAIDWLRATLGYEILYVSRMMTLIHVVTWALVTLACVLPLVLLWLQFLKSATLDDRKLLVVLGKDYLLVPLVCLIPLFFIGTDWHRWLAFPFATATVCILMSAPLKAPFEADRRMKAYFIGLVLISLNYAPTALYFSAGSAANGPLGKTARLIFSSSKLEDSSVRIDRTRLNSVGNF